MTDAAKHPRNDALAPYRQAAYEDRIPWERHESINWWGVQALFQSMSKTLTTGEELTRLFHLMDEARANRMAHATGDAGDVLMDRARGKRGYAPLPADWTIRAEAALAGGKNSSAAFWAGAMLRAAGHKVPQHEPEDHHQHRPGPEHGSPPDVDGGGLGL